jgi:two-component sensor histidine kinase
MPAAITSRFGFGATRTRPGVSRLDIGLLIVAAFAVGGVIVDARAPSWEGALDAASGLALAGCGVILIRRLPSRRPGVMFLAASVAWFAGTVLPAVGTPAGVGTVMALTLHRGPLVDGILSAPARRTRSALTVAVVASAWITGAVTPLARRDGVTLAVGASFALAGLSLLRGGRRDLLTRVAAAAACAYGLATGMPAALRLGNVGNDRVAITAYMVTVIALSIALALAARSARESAVVALVIDLGDRPDGSTLRRTLARAVGEPELAVGIWLDDEQRYVDELGRPLVGASPDSEIPLFVDGRRVGALFHAPSTTYEGGIVEDAAAVAALAVESARLQADAERGVQELRAARRRIVEQTDEQRRLIGEQIRRGADRHLEAAESLLRNARGELADPVLLDEFVETRASILSLATGLDASLPSEDRLREAADRRTIRSSVPVELHLERMDLSDQWQHALLLVFAEAVTNAIKHSGCTCISAELRTIPGGVTMEIADDGIGGADEDGFGLSGLRDRIGALGGSVEVASPAGSGTTIRATLLAGRASAQTRLTCW